MSGLIDKDQRKLLRELERAGCVIRRTGRGHLRVTLNGAHVVTFAGTSGDARSGRNARAAIRRAGLQVTA